MNRSRNKYISKAMEMAKALMAIADEAEAAGCDDSCCILFGVMRDCAYKIRKQAERQYKVHKTKITN